jgi:hypothetical protein
MRGSAMLLHLQQGKHHLLFMGLIESTFAGKYSGVLN